MSEATALPTVPQPTAPQPTAHKNIMYLTLVEFWTGFIAVSTNPTLPLCDNK